MLELNFNSDLSEIESNHKPHEGQGEIFHSLIDFITRDERLHITDKKIFDTKVNIKNLMSKNFSKNFGK